MRRVLWMAVAMCGGVLWAADPLPPVKVFILAGDENCLEQAAVSGRTVGTDAVFSPNEKPVKDEPGRHVNCAVYKGTYEPGTDYGKRTPELTALVALGEDQSKKRKPIVLTPYPELAMKEGYTTVLRGYVTVPCSGQYEVYFGDGESAFNVTTVEGREVWRREPGQATATITALPLEAKKRHAFQVIFFRKPGHDIRFPQVNRPGTLTALMAEKKQYAFLKDLKRDDVILYDAHPIYNNTRAPGRPLQLQDAIGPEMLLGQVLGNQFEEPVFLLRHAMRHPVGFLRGSRSLGQDYLPPSSGGDPDLKGTWDVIHFNWGVWDAGYKEVSSKYYQGHGNTTTVEDFEKNLRTLVARMKKTGATLIWASVTPVWKGEPGKPNGDVVAYNAVAEKVMQENGVIIDDLHSLVPKGTGSWVDPNVHATGNLAPKVTKTILEALANRKEKTKPLPRVLMIGDSITGGYLGKVMQDLDGKAVVYKNPGNAESSWTGLKKIDEWLDLKCYLQNGQEYLELVNGVKDSLAQLDRFCPGYQKQGYEIAGLVWMQGIADSSSPAQSAAYEKNLANLIRDIRKDLNTPKLPVVVAALKMGDGKVHAAQMAVGDPAKYPEFAGNVKSVDAQPFLRGGDPRTLGNNSETLLEVGDALGRAMLELMKDKSRASGNPIIKHVRTADPSVIVGKDGLIWLYTSHDQNDAVDYNTMDGYRVFSSSNLVDWKDHGEILHSKDLSWGDRSGFMFAPDAVFHKDTYYLYFPHLTKKMGFKIGVATSKSPEGPFKEQGYVVGPKMKGGFDPRCFIDDDGQAYLYWGSPFDTKAPMVAKLKENMVELAEEPRIIDYGRGAHFTRNNSPGEGIYMHKRKGVYYFSFSAFDGYAAMGDNPYGPFTRLHKIAAGGKGAQDHHSIVEIAGEWYYFYHIGNYHDGKVDGSLYRRNVCVDKLYYNPDGTIKLVAKTDQGVEVIGVKK